MRCADTVPIQTHIGEGIIMVRNLFQDLNFFASRQETGRERPAAKATWNLGLGLETATRHQIYVVFAWTARPLGVKALYAISKPPQELICSLLQC